MSDSSPSLQQQFRTLGHSHQFPVTATIPGYQVSVSWMLLLQVESFIGQNPVELPINLIALWM
jgi:hypothetical protein